MKITKLVNRQEGQFIYYDGKYWLVHNYSKDVVDGGGWFASPIFFKKDDIVEVVVGAGNWCYVCNGAFHKEPEIEVVKKAYLSYLEHLNWCKETQQKMNTDTIIINDLIQFYHNLLSNTNALVIQSSRKIGDVM